MRQLDDAFHKFRNFNSRHSPCGMLQHGGQSGCSDSLSWWTYWDEKSRSVEYFYMIVSPRRFLAAMSAVAIMGVAAPVMAQTAEPTTPAVSAPEHAPDAAAGTAAPEAGAKKHHSGSHHGGHHHGAKKAAAGAEAPAAPAAQ
ncbi:hypothetical protein GLX_14030 [Komagataeibacter medellinensis NBRC 3288]|uniref:Uncharacterized protein n=2 Tax=Komagataeibacter medellinensis TaxID=1177712 RepID=G2I6R8_KOMMN|nr:hypothetical protein GLX_14030 [Komagataeibacter medellinensis NBRC 3288]